MAHNASAQNVGIGTATPTEKLHVVGGARIEILSGVGYRLVQADATGVLSTILDGSSGQVLTTNGAGSYSFQTLGGNNTLDMAYDEGGAGAGRIITADAGTVEINGTGGLWVNATTTTISEAVLVNNSDGTNSTDTKIGYVGTSGANTYAYGIRSEARLTSATNVFDGGYGVYGLVKHPTNGTIDLNFTATSSGISVNKAVGVFGGVSAQSNYIGGPQDVIAGVYAQTGLHNSGNGSVTGGAKLYAGVFSGNGRTLGLWGENSTFIELMPKWQIRDYDAGIIGFYNSDPDGGNNDADIGTGDSYFSIEANVTDATVKDVVLQTRTTGNVGIGTNAPTYKLQIDGGATPLNITGGGAAFPKLRLDVESPGDAIFRLYDFNVVEDVRLATNGDSWYNGSGNFGIGTATPSTKLDVVGVLELSNTVPTDPGSDIVRLGDGGTNLQIQTNYGYTRIGPQNTSWSHFMTDRARYYFDKGITVNTGLIGSYDEDLSLQTAGTTRMTIDITTGNVGIGTTVPAYTLQTLAGGTVSVNDGYVRQVRAHYLQDWDDNTGGIDNKYRLLARDGAHMFYNGGVVVGNYGNGTWTDLNDGYLIVEYRTGIATTAPTAQLSVNGIANKTGGGTWAVFSDKRLKENISEYSEGLELIRKVRPVSFSYNTKMTEIWGENEQTKGKVYQGVIAQELQKIAPDMVREVNVAQKDGTPGESFLEVDPNKFTYALINAVQEQQKQIDVLKAEIKALKEANK